MARMWFNPKDHGSARSHAARVSSEEAQVIREGCEQVKGGVELRPCQHQDGRFYVYTDDPHGVEKLLSNI